MVSACSSCNPLSPNSLLAGMANNRAVDQLRTQDASVRTEIARKASAAGLSGTATIDFTYSIGPDGQLYATGGQVSSSRKVRASELTSLRSANSRDDHANDNADSLSAPRRGARFNDFLPPQVALSPLELAQLQEWRDTPNPQAIAELSQIDAGVRGHERQHFFSAGGLASGLPHYDYTTGPDGRQYATGGHVDVGTTPTRDPEKASRDAAALSRAASAPGDASAADVSAANGNAGKAAERYNQAGRLGEENALDIAA